VGWKRAGLSQAGGYLGCMAWDVERGTRLCTLLYGTDVHLKQCKLDDVSNAMRIDRHIHNTMHVHNPRL
jgi:hypothetical protein